MNPNQKTRHRQICNQFLGKRQILFEATNHEFNHGRDISWALRAKYAPELIRESWVGTTSVLKLTATGTRDCRPFQAIHLFLTSLRSTP
jgi:hypothetical protein